MQRKRKDLNTISTGKKKTAVNGQLSITFESCIPGVWFKLEVGVWGEPKKTAGEERRKWNSCEGWQCKCLAGREKEKEKRHLNKCSNEKWEGGEKKSPQESQNERITEFLPDNFFKRFPQGRATAWIKLLKAWWENILAAQFCFPVKSNISRPHKIMVSVLWKIAIFLTIVSRMFYFSLPYTQWQEWQALFIKAGPFET